MTETQLQHKWLKYYQQLNSQKNDPVTLYLNSLAPTGRRSVRCLLQSAAQLLNFEGELETMPWGLVDFQQVTLIRNQLQQQAKSANTINLTLSALRGVSKLCFSVGLISAEQWLLLKAVKRVRGKRSTTGQSLTAAQIKHLYRSLSQDKTAAGKRDYAVIALMLATGLRRAEVRDIDMADYNPKTGVLQVKAGKGNQPRTAYLNTDSRAVLRTWLQVRGRAGGALFNPIGKTGVIQQRALCSESIYHLIKARTEAAGLTDITPHDLRRTFVTQLLVAGVDLNTTRQLVGHADIQTTAKYDLRDKQQQRKALKQLYR